MSTEDDIKAAAKNLMRKEPSKYRGTRYDGNAPRGPHLTVQHRAGQAMGIPCGAMMGIVMDPTKMSPMHRLVLLEVSHSKLLFRCTCNPTCGVIYQLRIEEKGAHSR